MSQSDQTRSLPVALAARLVFDSISYSNSLPPWSDPVMESFAGEEGAIRKRISKYLDGETPSRPFTIAVPKRSIWEQGESALGIGRDELQHWIDQLRREVGPPWAQDQKLAALAAWIALARST